MERMVCCADAGVQGQAAHLRAPPDRALQPPGHGPTEESPPPPPPQSADSELVLDDNLIIHGDNLRALKALLPRYAGKVNCIYIDPPYNTGSQSWVYNDRVNSPLMQEWFRCNSPVDGEDLERHDKWLCMLWPRLQLLRDLLADDAVLLISIDDHEQHHLRAMIDEVFGPTSFIACLAAVVNLKGSRDNRGFANTHEYVLLYEKVPGAAMLRDLVLDESETEDWIEDELGWYKIGATLRYSGENAPRHKRPNLYYPLYVSTDGSISTIKTSDSDYEVWPLARDGSELTWRWGRERVAENASEVVARLTSSGWSLHKKQRPAIGVAPTRKPKTTFYAPSYSATTATTILKEIFGGDRVFDYPKSPLLLQDLFRIVCSRTDAIIVDSFAGSGTTAHAVLALNREDGGDRRFILVECEDYADNITAERVRRVISGVTDAKDDALRAGLGGSFTYCTLGDPIDADQMLSGESLPDYSDLAAHLLYTAVGKSVGAGIVQPPDGEPFHADGDTDYYLLYRPDPDWLCGNDAMFTTTMAQRIAENGRAAVVFAAGKYMSQRDLTPRGITFCQLPYELHRSG